MNYLFCAFVLISSSLFASTFKIEKTKNQFNSQRNVLYVEGDLQVVTNKGILPLNYSDLYVIKLPNISNIPEALNTLIKVEGFAPNKLAVVRVKQENLIRVSSILHEINHSCGMMFRLYGDQAFLDHKIIDPKPLVEIKKEEFINASIAKVLTSNIKQKVAELEKIPTRFHRSNTGVKIASLLADKYKEYAKDRKDVTISTFSHGSKTKQDSLVVRIEGSKYPDEISILGSHIDSISGWFGFGRIAPGADDNASGTAVNLEIFRVLMESGVKLQRTLEIHGYAAEEVGLVGSQDIAKQYRNDGKNVISMLQFDMMLWKAPGTPDKLWFVTNKTNNTLTKDLAKIISLYSNVEIGFDTLDGGSSDHDSWNRQGYAAAFPTENPHNYNRNIHTEYDTSATSPNFEQASFFAKLGVGYVLHYAGYDLN